MARWLKTLVSPLRLYRLAAGLYETYRLVARPHSHGALVAIWWEERLLLVQSSYRDTLSLPGGGLEAEETALQAAVRELAEGTGSGGGTGAAGRALDDHRALQAGPQHGDNPGVPRS